jgi:hypothetical protein
MPIKMNGIVADSGVLFDVGGLDDLACGSLQVVAC